MRHVTVENLINYADGQASDVEKSTLDSHLTGCKECTNLKQEFQALITRLREDSSFEPPADLVQWGINLFQPVMHLTEKIVEGDKVRRKWDQAQTPLNVCSPPEF